MAGVGQADASTSRRLTPGKSVLPRSPWMRQSPGKVVSYRQRISLVLVLVQVLTTQVLVLNSAASASATYVFWKLYAIFI